MAKRNKSCFLSTHLFVDVPTITLSCSVRGHSDGQVIEKEEFTIGCHLPHGSGIGHSGGHFHLMHTGYNTTVNDSLPAIDQTLPAVNHSANFVFPAADKTHNQNFTCLYEIQIFGHKFQSESPVLSVTVTGNYGNHHSMIALTPLC